MKVWMLCEAFTLTGDAFGHQTVQKSLAPWGIPCGSREVAMRELEECVKERVIENYEGKDDACADIKFIISVILSSPAKLGRNRWQYSYSADDREIVWQVYPCEVMQ